MIYSYYSNSLHFGHQITKLLPPFHPLTMTIETLYTKGATNRGPAGLVAASVVS